ncbi:hypothetical protein AMTR_s00114p00022160 [Amborella trichopoda]|uniref:VAN3-binding protein-like auxin canalisation domain-containing protein n=1 Tax=Amborella trichopoda TaxID=13333 RepID=W1NPU2_AMBTC|nr:hypothetical protein AMTR_s00114p00022160 [Amborella trichopoda]
MSPHALTTLTLAPAASTFVAAASKLAPAASTLAAAASQLAPTASTLAAATSKLALAASHMLRHCLQMSVNDTTRPGSVAKCTGNGVI